MPLLKPESTTVQAVVTSLKSTTVESIDAYVAFLNSLGHAASGDSVLNDAAEYVFDKDRDFLAWKEKNAGPFPSSLRVRSVSKQRQKHASDV
jgi:hypothetical protein